MGMDVYGNDPKNSKGEYFRASIWGWPTITTVMEACGYDVPITWHANDGEGLTTQESCDQLADMMDGYLSEGLLTYAPVCTPLGAAVANVITKGLSDDVETDMKKIEATDVKPINVEFVQDFITFLRACGGFRIC